MKHIMKFDEYEKVNEQEWTSTSTSSDVKGYEEKNADNPPTISKSVTKKKKPAEQFLDLVKKMKSTNYNDVEELLKKRLNSSKGKCGSEGYFDEKYLRDFKKDKWFEVKLEDSEELYKLIPTKASRYFIVQGNGERNECAMYVFRYWGENNIIYAMVINSYGGTITSSGDYDEDDFDEDDEEEGGATWNNWFVAISTVKND